MGDSILHYTTALTDYITFGYLATFLVGVYLAAKFHRGGTALVGLLGVVGGLAVRMSVHPLSIEGIIAMVVVHVAGGALIGAWLRGKMSYQYQPPAK